MLKTKKDKCSKEFEKKFGGKVFIVFSIDDKIENEDILQEIDAEIIRLKG